MKKNEPIRHIMSESVITTHHGEKLSEIRKKMQESGIHHLPVVSGTKLIGLISAPDILKYAFSSAFVPKTVDGDSTLDQLVSLEDVMIKNLVTIKSTDTVKHAAEMLSTREYNALPVVDDEQNLKGIVTTKDLITYLLDQY